MTKKCRECGARLPADAHDDLCSLNCRVSARLKADGVDPESFTFHMHGIEVRAIMLVQDALLPTAEATVVKWGALENLGIRPDFAQSPLQAWLDHIAQTNNLPVEHPPHPVVRLAIRESDDAMLFCYWLANRSDELDELVAA